jgi:hypothetical protein
LKIILTVYFLQEGWWIIRLLGSIGGQKTDAMNESLVRPFVEEEIRAALFQMSLLKAPKPDGFNARFFQKNWDIVGLEVCKATLFFFSSLNSVVLDHKLNSTFLALIPKTKNLTNVTVPWNLD